MKCTTMQNLLVFAIYGEINSELVLLSFGASVLLGSIDFFKCFVEMLSSSRLAMFEFLTFPSQLSPSSYRKTSTLFLYLSLSPTFCCSPLAR